MCCSFLWFLLSLVLHFHAVDFLIKDSGITGNVPANLCSHMDLIFTDCAVNRCAATSACLQTCQGPNCGGWGRSTPFYFFHCIITCNWCQIFGGVPKIFFHFFLEPTSGPQRSSIPSLLLSYLIQLIKILGWFSVIVHFAIFGWILIMFG